MVALAKHLVGPYGSLGMSSALVSEALLRPRALRDDEKLNGDWVLQEFLSYVEKIGLELYPAQEEAILEISAGNNVILNTPTGSGKSLVALAACFAALSYGERAYYTAPIKALVSEKFLQLCKVFGPENVGMMTGDATVNHDAPVICCTAEILSNLALREGKHADLEWVVMDEFHYYSDRDRGVAWQIPLLTLPHARFLLMSATLGDTSFFQQQVTQLTGQQTRLVQSSQRPVPLDFSYVTTPFHETITDLLQAGKSPIYVVHFSQRAASEQAQRLTSLDFLTKEQKAELKAELKGVRFDSPFGKELARFVPHGIGVHHAGMLPKYRLLVEKLAQRGLLKVICGTDTLGVGINIPLRCVVFTQLCKFDGDKVKILSVRDFHQIAGRAGRRGFDTEGSVVVQAPEHVIENLAARRKAEGDPKKLRKLHPKKPPEKGFLPWDENTLSTLIRSSPEALVSRFSVTTSMVLNVLSRKDESGCRALKRLIADCHDPRDKQHKHGRSALAVFRALVESGIIELTADGPRLSRDLQDDFSLNQALSLFAVQVIESLDRTARDYALSVLSAVEAILEDPGVLLARQLDTLKARRLAELKHAGVEFDERIAELERMTYPKPDAEVLEAAFQIFSKQHPWVLGNDIAPKSIVRDMYELGLSFNAYVKEYGLQRSEGVLLRYLSEAYRVLVHTVPESLKTDELSDVIDWLSGELKATDASLLDEWRRLTDPALLLLDKTTTETDPGDITADRKSFTIMLRNEVWRVVQALARKNYQAAAETLSLLRPPQAAIVDAARLERDMSEYFSEYEQLRVDPQARHPKFLHFDVSSEQWLLRQTLVDPSDDLAWSIELSVNVPQCRDEGRVMLELVKIASD